MIGKKEIIQNAEGNATNVNTDKPVTINQMLGLSLRDTRELIEDTLWESYPKLASEAKLEAQKHATGFITDLFTNLASGDIQALQESIKDPEKLTTITECLYSVAKRTHKIDKNILQELLVKKINNDDIENDQEGLILNQSLSAAANLTKSHIIFLSILHFIKNISIRCGNSFYSYLSTPPPLSDDGKLIINPAGNTSLDFFNDQFKDVYRDLFHKLFLDSLDKIKPIDIAYLEHMSCVSLNSFGSANGFISINPENILEGIEKNIGASVESAEGQEVISPIMNALALFGIKYLSRLGDIKLTPIGLTIASTDLDSRMSNHQ